MTQPKRNEMSQCVRVGDDCFAATCPCHVMAAARNDYRDQVGKAAADPDPEEKRKERILLALLKLAARRAGSPLYVSTGTGRAYMDPWTMDVAKHLDRLESGELDASSLKDGFIYEHYKEEKAA